MARDNSTRAGDKAPPSTSTRQPQPATVPSGPAPPRPPAPHSAGPGLAPSSRPPPVALVSTTSRRAYSTSALSLATVAGAASAPLEPGLESPLEPPAPPFSARSSRNSRRSSASSLRSDTSSLPSTPEEPAHASVASGDLSSPPLLSSPSPRFDLASALSRSAPASPSASTSRLLMNGYGRDDVMDGSAQEELLDEDVRNAAGTQGQRAGYDDPYRWERPLDTVNRHSRLLDGSPIYPPSSSAPTSQSTTTDGRRLSRLPPGVALVDPFGFNVSNEPSPYDLAYAHSAAAQTSGITAASSPRSAARASFLGAYSAMGSGGAPPGVTASPGPSPTISPSPSTSSVTQFAAPPQQGEYGAPAQPWVKQRAASAGEPGQTARAQVRNGLLAPGAGLRHSTTGRSKLSGEIDADDVSVASIASRQPAKVPAVPTESDYLNSKVYQRTLKAQRALEKERAKAAAKGKLSRYDANAPASKSTSSLISTTSTLGGGFGAFSLSSLGQRRSVDSGRPPSVMSAAGVSGTTSAKRGGRKSLGWFRSTSEGGLTLSQGLADGATADPALPTSKSSSGVSLAAARALSGQSSPRLSPGGAGAGAGPGVSGGQLVPPLPPSPNLPSESTLRAMGVSTDQLRAAAQQQQGQRPRSRGRPSSNGGTSPGGAQGHAPGQGQGQGQGQKRSPQPSPRLDPSVAAFASALPPPAATMPLALAPPVSAQPPKEAAVPLAVPQPTRPGPPARVASLEPPSSSTSSTPFTTPPSTVTSTPVPPSTLASVPPRTASRKEDQPHDVPLPRSASPTRTTFPLNAMAPAPAVPQATSRAPSQPEQQQPRPLAASLPAGAAPPKPPAEIQAPPSPNKLAPAPASQSSVKRRKSGLGLLFGGVGAASGSESGAASPEGARGDSPTPSSASSATAREKDKVIKRAQQQHQQQSQAAPPAGKLTKEQAAPAPPAAKLTKPGGGGFFSRSASRLRSSSGPSSAPQPPAPSPKATKKADEPFYHPSQALHAARAAPQPPQLSSPQPPAIRAVNPSPQIPQAPTMRHRPSNGPSAVPGPQPAPGAGAGATRTDSSSGSSTTFSSLSSSGSTLVPGTPSGGKGGSGPTSPQPLPAKKGGFASLFSIGGSIRGRKSSTPGPLSRSQGAAPVAPRVADVRPSPTSESVPGLPRPPAAAAAGSARGKPLRGQSLGATQSPGQAQQAQVGQQQPGQQPGQGGQLPGQRPYATYA